MRGPRPAPSGNQKEEGNSTKASVESIPGSPAPELSAPSRKPDIYALCAKLPGMQDLARERRCTGVIILLPRKLVSNFAATEKLAGSFTRFTDTLRCHSRAAGSADRCGRRILRVP